jgi:hypothetical protein
MLEGVGDKFYQESVLNLTFIVATFNFNLSFYELDADSDLKEN